MCGNNLRSPNEGRGGVSCSLLSAACSKPWAKWVLHLGVLRSLISLNFLESLLPQERVSRAGWMWASSVRAGGGAREEWAAQAEGWVAHAEEAAVAIHLLGLALSLSELVAMIHVRLWNFIKHVSREGHRSDSPVVGLLGRGLHISFLLGGCFFLLSSSFSCLSQDTSSAPCGLPCPPPPPLL